MDTKTYNLLSYDGILVYDTVLFGKLLPTFAETRFL